MKTLNPAARVQFWPRFLVTLLGLFAVIFAIPSARAEIIIIEPRAGGQNNAFVTEGVGGWGTSSATTLPTGGTTSPSGTAPGATGGTIGSTFATASGATFSLIPTGLLVGGVYQIDNTIPNTGSSASVDTTLTISGTGFTGLGTTLPTTTGLFRKPGSTGGPTKYNNWETIGTFTATVANPTITFTHTAGTVTRTFVASMRLLRNDPRSNVPQLNSALAPIYAGQTTVTVTGVDPTATAVFVYTNNNGLHSTCIGTNSAPAGASSVPVTVSPLVKGRRLQFSQVVGGNEGYPDSGGNGPLVGGGTNGSVRIVSNSLV